MYKLLVFGNGGLWSIVKNYIDSNKAEIIGFVNSDLKLNGTFFEDKPVITPQEIMNYEFDYIVLASGQYDELINQLKDTNLEKEKIIAFKINGSKVFQEIQDQANCRILEETNQNSLNLISRNNVEPYFLVNMNMLGREREFELTDGFTDYVRLSTLELIANEINTCNIPGNVAELGVYKGDFSKHINRLFPAKKLYLFDTFQGFDNRDILIDLQKKYSSETTRFTDTTIDLVMKKMKYPENIHIRKGYFPETSEGLEDQFSFVSIDTDLYKPIYDGLTYFYPRLVKGGYIFVHDYNNAIFKGAKEAVRKFCSENSIPYVPVSDNLGTVIIAK